MQSFARKCGPWSVSDHGLRRPSPQYLFEDTHTDLQKGLHGIRADWRLRQFSNWLGTDKVDAGINRAQRLQITPQLAQALLVGAQKHDGYALGVATGALKPLAIDFGTKFLFRKCPLRQESTIPSLPHVLSECQRSSDLRCCRVPASQLAARLGWDKEGVHHEVLAQLGRIRKATSGSYQG